ncbi:enoyl-CoA hydratase/isomerase family protein [Humibacter sp. RRB41]|uniref:enoyl-CoA hydratase/isomerase family protein n=1 Tax=Humibacter sp. RRB41 TaxID=2919946 RepID=UPI001FA96A30|nr:enoyl-CoA hydratase/isomerase family protein [Humibacter sp. RRB41]
MSIRTERNGDVVEVVLDWPEKLNSLDLDALVELDSALGSVEDARALVLRGEGRAFCAGRDVSHVDPATDDPRGYLDTLTALLHRLAEFPAPTFGVATGACLGVGLGLLIATDVVYVADTARIGSPFAGLGAALDSGGHALFVARLGTHRALDLIYTGELMSGADAVASGLFSRVVPADDVLAFTREKAAAVAAGPTAAFVTEKRLVARLRDDRIGLWDSVADETDAQVALSATADYAEGFAAFREKRRPGFTGR